LDRWDFCRDLEYEDGISQSEQLPQLENSPTRKTQLQDATARGTKRYRG
jgi:hypothetical protein